MIHLMSHKKKIKQKPGRKISGLRNFRSGVNLWIFLSALTCCCSVLLKKTMTSCLKQKQRILWNRNTGRIILTLEFSNWSPNHCFYPGQHESHRTLELSTPQNMLEPSTLPSISGELSALQSRGVQDWSRAGTLRSLVVAPPQTSQLVHPQPSSQPPWKPPAAASSTQTSQPVLFQVLTISKRVSCFNLWKSKVRKNSLGFVASNFLFIHMVCWKRSKPNSFKLVKNGVPLKTLEKIEENAGAPVAGSIYQRP